MKKQFGLWAALLLFSAAVPLRAQNSTRDRSDGSQSNYCEACSDPLPANAPQSISDDLAGAQSVVGSSPSRGAASMRASQASPQDRNLGTMGQPSGGSTESEGGPQSSPNGQQTFPPDPPTEFQNFVAATLGERLPVYGSDLFLRVPTTFAPSNRTPVPPQYVVGPGDELQIRIWGEITYSGNLIVDRSGAIFLPQVGSVPVAGLPFSALDARLRSAVGKTFRNFDIAVDMGRLRSIQVYLSGQVRRPGAYTLSSLSTLVDALFATGGPSPQGSLRHLYLKRDGKTIVDFDLYDLLLHGDKSKDVRLLPEDVLYIPPVGSQAAIVGSVRLSAIYELRGNDTIGDLIQMAAGTTSVASNSRISIDRANQKRDRVALEVNFDPTGLATSANDGDIVRILSIIPAYSKTITVRGNLANPGHFAWREGLRLSDVIPDRDSLLTRNYWWERSHLGLPTPEFEPWISQSTQLRQVLAPSTNGPANQEQQNGTLAASQSTNGNAQQNIGNNPLLDAQARQLHEVQENLQHNDVSVTQSSINWNYAVIERVNPETLQTSLIPFNLGKLVVDHDQTQNLEVKPGDVITIFSDVDIHLPLDQQIKYVQLDGEFVRSGFYSVAPGETLRDLVARAGGLTPKAYLYGSQFTRATTRVLQQARLDEYARSLTLDAERSSQAFALSSNANAPQAAQASQALTQQMLSRLSSVRATGRIVFPFSPAATALEEVPAIPLENGDKFVVPFTPNIVTVVGAVYDQNSFIFRPKRTVGFYLQLAGGANRNADARHAFVIRADGSVLSRTNTGGKGFFKQSFENIELYAGDAVVVPDKTLHPTALRDFLQWTQMFSQLALGAAAINVL